MKAFLILGCMLILTNVPASHAQQLKFSDPNYKLVSDLTDDIGWYQITETKAWAVKDGATLGLKGARCMATLDKLRAAGVPDTTIANVRYDAPEFRRGPHTLAEIRTSCAHLETLGKIKYFERWAKFAMEDTPNLSKGNYDVSYFKNCLQAYDEIVKAGVSPTERVPDDVIKGAPWSGSIEELRKKWCDAGFSTGQRQNGGERGALSQGVDERQAQGRAHLPGSHAAGRCANDRSSKDGGSIGLVRRLFAVQSLQ